jgi:hypothetical protein
MSTSHFDQEQEYLSTAKMTENPAAFNEYSDLGKNLQPVASDVTFSAKPMVEAQRIKFKPS